MPTKKKIWYNILKDLESNISPPEIDTWFSKAELSKFDDNLALIDVPNKFIANWLRDNYSDVLNNSFKKITNKKPELLFNYQNNKDNINKKKIYNKYKNLNKYMTFENFTTGECNQFAYSSAVEIAENPGDYYNPFYIFFKIQHWKNTPLKFHR